MEDENGTSEEFEEEEDFAEQIAQRQAELGEILVLVDDEPEENLLNALIIKTIEEGLASVKEKLDDLVRSMRPRFEIRERGLCEKPFVVFRNHNGGEQEELGDFSQLSDAEHFLRFLRNGGWDGVEITGD